MYPIVFPLIFADAVDPSRRDDHGYIVFLMSLLFVIGTCIYALAASVGYVKLTNAIGIIGTIRLGLSGNLAIFWLLGRIGAPWQLFAVQIPLWVLIGICIP